MIVGTPVIISGQYVLAYPGYYVTLEYDGERPNATSFLAGDVGTPSRRRRTRLRKRERVLSNADKEGV